MNKAIEKSITTEEKLIISEKILPLLAKQTSIYTGGDSSSIPAKTAKELLESVLFVLGADREISSPQCRKLLDSNIDDEFRKGIRRTENKIKCTKELWKKVYLCMPKEENLSLRDTVLSIGEFEKNYDYRLFAAKIPCDIDYQLSLPVSESLMGIDYITEYLERLYFENAFLNFFAEVKCKSVLKNFCPDYKGLLINLFEPVASDAMALELLGKNPAELYISTNDREKLLLLFENLEEEKIAALFKSAALRIAGKQRITAKKYRNYLLSFSEELSKRVYLLKDKGGLEGIFP